MDGVGSRLGRASSRYGPTPVFTGPVRRWKKRWVEHINTATTTLNSGNNSAAKAVRIPRWTPVSSSDAVISDESTRRKLRYTPIVVLEEKKKNVAKLADIESKTSERIGAAPKPLNRNRMDLDLSLNGNDSEHDFDSESK